MSSAMVISLLYWVLSIGCWAYALRSGGWESRVAFALFVMNTIGTILSTASGLDRSADLSLWQHTNLGLFAADSLYVVGLYVLALRSRRYWPIWSAGFQLVCALTHFGPLLDPHTNAKLYRGLETVWMLPILVTMTIGIAKDRKFERRGKQVSR